MDYQTNELAGPLDALLARRHSCRAFTKEPVDTAIVNRILATAQRTASWCNSQPWHVHISRGDGTEKLRRALFESGAKGHVDTDIPFPEAYEGVYQARRRECGLQLYETLGIAKDDRAATGKQALLNFKFFGAPHLAIITTEKKLGTYGAVDCGAYVSNFMLAAESLGVATIAQAAIASQSDILHELLNIGPERMVVCGISFGYAEKTAPVNAFRTTRAAVDSTVTWVDA